jgi:aminomuconate-semialdehyde/2-hydroxymuconate-6-semialdehyde dehydrogenase
VFGNGINAGAPLVNHLKVPLVSFTGGTSTGEVIYKACSTMNKKMSLELGGKNACIIFDDANLEEAVATTARSSFTNQGQICLCTSRIYVHEGIYEEFVEKLKLKVEEIVVGDPFDASTTMGPLVSEPHFKKVKKNSLNFF